MHDQKNRIGNNINKMKLFLKSTNRYTYELIRGVRIFFSNFMIPITKKNRLKDFISKRNFKIL